MVGAKLHQLKRQYGLAQLIGKKAAIIGDARIDGDTRELVDMSLRLKHSIPEFGVRLPDAA